VLDQMPPQDALDTAVGELIGYLQARSPTVSFEVISAPS